MTKPAPAPTMTYSERMKQLGTKPAAAAGEGRVSPISELYELWTLDVLPTLGCRTAEIFEANPRQFKRVPAEISSILARLHYRTGYDENLLSVQQRSRLIEPLLGESDGTRHNDNSSKFHQAASGLRKAAVDYVQRSFDTGERELRNAFRDAAKTMFVPLTELESAVTNSALARISGHFAHVVTVLQNSDFCSGLGLPPAPEGDWPRSGIVDGDGATLISELTRAELTRRFGTTDVDAVPEVSVTQFVAIQRAADYGASSIDKVLHDPAMDDDNEANSVINTVYRWWTALRDLRGDSTGFQPGARM